MAAGAFECRACDRAARRPGVPDDRVRERRRARDRQRVRAGGRLRAAINHGNPVLAQRDAATGALGGVTVDLARELGRPLKVAVELVPFDTAGKVADSANAGVWDIAFLAVEPVRANEIAFTAPYVLIEGAYMVPPGRRCAASTRSIARACASPSADGSPTTSTCRAHQARHARARADLCGGHRACFARQARGRGRGEAAARCEYAADNPDVRMIEGRFMVIEQAMGMPKGGRQAAPICAASSRR